MNDGAHLGVRAAAAMARIVGGKEIEEQDIADLNAVRERIMATEPVFGPDASESGYNTAADYAARLVYETFIADPSTALLPTDQEWDFSMTPPRTLHERTLAMVVREDPRYEVLQGRYGLTGFQWGWAVNVARALVELPPAPNPAIIVFEVPSDD